MRDVNAYVIIPQVTRLSSTFFHFLPDDLPLITPNSLMSMPPWRPPASASGRCSWALGRRTLPHWSPRDFHRRAPEAGDQKLSLLLCAGSGLSLPICSMWSLHRVSSTVGTRQDHTRGLSYTTGNSLN